MTVPFVVVQTASRAVSSKYYTSEHWHLLVGGVGGRRRTVEQYETAILDEVKKELEHVDSDYHVCQWVLAMAVREEPPDCWLDEKQTFLARIVTKTDECIPVDGLDVLFCPPVSDIIKPVGIYKLWKPLITSGRGHPHVLD